MFGSGVYDMWYGGYYPDLFDALYFEGYLPGRPSFSAAIREAQKQGRHIAAAYVQGSAGVDYTRVTPPVANPTQLQLDIKASAAIQEDGSENVLNYNPQRPMIQMCNGAAAWSQIFVDNIVSIVDHTSARAAIRTSPVTSVVPFRFTSEPSSNGLAAESLTRYNKPSDRTVHSAFGSSRLTVKLPVAAP